MLLLEDPHRRVQVGGRAVKAQLDVVSVGVVELEGGLLEAILGGWGQLAANPHL